MGTYFIVASDPLSPLAYLGMPLSKMVLNDIMAPFSGGGNCMFVSVCCVCYTC